jgi:outer membrane protein W
MSKISLILFAIVVCAMSIIASTASAQNSEITLYVGGFRGESFISKPAVLFPEVQAVFDDKVTVGARYAYFFTDRLAFEAGAGFTPSSILSKGSIGGGNTEVQTLVDVDTWVMHANLTAHLLKARVIPYVTGGVGALHFSFKTSRFGFLTPSETDFAWNAGGGIKIPVRDTTALRFDGRVYWYKPDFSVEDTGRFTEITGGVSILFDF